MAGKQKGFLTVGPLLNLDGVLDGIGGGRETSQDPVSHFLDEFARVSVQQCIVYFPVDPEHFESTVLILPHQGGVPEDVGEPTCRRAVLRT